MAEENIDPGQQKIIDLLSKIASDRSNAKAEEAAVEEKRTAKKNIKAIRDNGLALVGLTAGMFSLKSMIGNQLKMNQDLAVALGQTGDVTRGMSAATDRFLRGQQGAEQMVKVFKDAVDMGMSEFSNQTLRFGAQMKVLGIQNKTSFQLMRANTQGLGLAEEASLSLAQDLITTAVENKDSISGLIDAINSMKDTMIDTAVELGPKAALNAQKIAAMMSQGNSELQESSAKFVKSFLAGSDGYMKAAKLGVQFTGDESTAGMARKFETILGKIQGLQSGKQGAGSQFFFDAMEKSFGLSREDFNLQTQIGTSINSLKEGSVAQLAKDSASLNLQQTIWNATEPFQVGLIKLTGDFSKEVSNILNKITEFNATLGNYFLPIIAGIFSLVGFLGLRGILGALRGGGSLLKGIWKGFKWLGLSFSKVVKSLFSGAKNMVMDVLTNPLGKKAGTKAVAKGAAKGLSKSLLKKIPLIGAVAGAAFAINRALEGDFTGAAMELASGVASTIPGVGTAVSVGFDAGLIAKDMKTAGGEDMVAEAKNRTSMMDAGMSGASARNGSVKNALKENTTILRGILESSKEGNTLSEELIGAMSQDAEPFRIRAGRMN